MILRLEITAAFVCFGLWGWRGVVLALCVRVGAEILITFTLAAIAAALGDESPVA